MQSNVDWRLPGPFLKIREHDTLVQSEERNFYLGHNSSLVQYLRGRAVGGKIVQRSGGRLNCLLECVFTGLQVIYPHFRMPPMWHSAQGMRDYFGLRLGSVLEDIGEEGYAGVPAGTIRELRAELASNTSYDAGDGLLNDTLLLIILAEMKLLEGGEDVNFLVFSEYKEEFGSHKLPIAAYYGVKAIEEVTMTNVICMMHEFKHFDLIFPTQEVLLMKPELGVSVAAQYLVITPESSKGSEVGKKNETIKLRNEGGTSLGQVPITSFMTKRTRPSSEESKDLDANESDGFSPAKKPSKACVLAKELCLTRSCNPFTVLVDYGEEDAEDVFQSGDREFPMTGGNAGAVSKMSYAAVAKSLPQMKRVVAGNAGFEENPDEAEGIVEGIKCAHDVGALLGRVVSEKVVLGGVPKEPVFVVDGNDSTMGEEGASATTVLVEPVEIVNLTSQPDELEDFEGGVSTEPSYATYKFGASTWTMEEEAAADLWEDVYPCRYTVGRITNGVIKGQRTRILYIDGDGAVENVVNVCDLYIKLLEGNEKAKDILELRTILFRRPIHSAFNVDHWMSWFTRVFMKHNDIVRWKYDNKGNPFLWRILTGFAYMLSYFIMGIDSGRYDVIDCIGDMLQTIYRFYPLSYGAIVLPHWDPIPHIVLTLWPMNTDSI